MPNRYSTKETISDYGDPSEGIYPPWMGGFFVVLMAFLVTRPMLFTFAASMAFWYGLKLAMGIRASLEEEIEGLDIGEHGNRAYPD